MGLVGELLGLRAPEPNQQHSGHSAVGSEALDASPQQMRVPGREGLYPQPPAGGDSGCGVGKCFI